MYSSYITQVHNNIIFFTQRMILHCSEDRVRHSSYVVILYYIVILNEVYCFTAVSYSLVVTGHSDVCSQRD